MTRLFFFFINVVARKKILESMLFILKNMFLGGGGIWDKILDIMTGIILAVIAFSILLSVFLCMFFCGRDFKILVYLCEIHIFYLPSSLPERCFGTLPTSLTQFLKSTYYFLSFVILYINYIYFCVLLFKSDLGLSIMINMLAQDHK